MKNVLKIGLLSLALMITSQSFASGANQDELAAKYPDIVEGSTKPENPKILCPFHRMLERAGLYDSSKNEAGPLLVGILKITSAAKEFGCKALGCGGVATAVSTGQLTEGTTSFGKVNLEALHTALGISHDCGLTFEKGGTEVSDAHRAATLAALKARTDKEGHLVLTDLQAVKESICAAQGVKNTLAGETEVKLIYSFLGGRDRGFIDYDDVERFLHAELPKTIGEPNSIGI